MSARVKAHLLGLFGAGIDRCPKMNAEYLAEIQKIVLCTKESGRLRNVSLSLLSTHNSFFELSQPMLGNKQRASTPLARALNIGATEQLKFEIT